MANEHFLLSRRLNYNMRLPAIVAGLLAIATTVGAQTVSLRIELLPDKSQFRIGEEISLKVTFELNAATDASAPPWQQWVTMMFDGNGRSVLGFFSDRFVVSPVAGTRDPWAWRLTGGIAYSGPGGIGLGDKPVTLSADLNQWVLFDRPGHYTVYAHCLVTGPQSQRIEVESNQIGIDIVAADPAWQAQELAADIAALQSTESQHDNRAFESRMNAAQRIAYLDTPAAVREMARQLGTADVQTAQIFADGLHSSAHTADAVLAMRDLLRSPLEPVSPIFLRTLVALDKTLDKTDKDAQSLLAGAIERKQGAAKAISLKTLLDQVPADGIPSNLRGEIAALFQDLPPGQQNELLTGEWKKVESQEMIPVLRQIYETAPQTRYPESPLLASAVERLYELDTSRTRTLLIEEMKRRDVRLPYHTLSMLPDSTLPELDSVFIDNLQHKGGQPVEELIARYSTKAILDPVKEFYAKRDAEMKSRVTANPNIAAPACEPPLVAYFLRVEPDWGAKVLRQSLAERSYTMGRCWIRIISQTAAYYSGAAWEKVAVEALQDPAVPVKLDAVESLGRFGSPDSKSAVFDAFHYWHEWWVNRGELNDESNRLENAFVRATTQPKNWTPSDTDLATIRDLCLTAGCKSQVPQHSN